MTEKLYFAPILENSPSKVTHGLSPLRFFKINKGEFINSIYYQYLNNKASVNTTANIEKARMCQPIMPRSPDELITTLKQRITGFHFLFGHQCHLALWVQKIVFKLKQRKDKYCYGAAFQHGMGYTIYNSISEGCVKFFEQYKNNYDIQRRWFANIDLNSILMALQMNVTTSFTSSSTTTPARACQTYPNPYQP